MSVFPLCSLSDPASILVSWVSTLLCTNQGWYLDMHWRLVHHFNLVYAGIISKSTPVLGAKTPTTNHHHAPYYPHHPSKSPYSTGHLSTTTAIHSQNTHHNVPPILLRWAPAWGCHPNPAITKVPPHYPWLCTFSHGSPHPTPLQTSVEDGHSILIPLAE